MTRRIYLIDCPGIVPTSAHDSLTSTVLKGVVRVEALPTPSDHIPALMARVKPLYLSRTYDVPLPDPNDPTKGWSDEPEKFLDTLARMKGRLLKGGEPDVEGVAKILLSDWVRGRIPFFVAPPERPAELDEKEEKERKRKKAKGKQADAPRVPGVTQKLGGIIQKNTFVGEDVRPLEEEPEKEAGGDEWTGFGGDDDDGEDGASEVEGDEDKEGAEVEEGDEDINDDEVDLAWDDVFNEGGKSEKNIAQSSDKEDADSEPEDDDDVVAEVADGQDESDGDSGHARRKDSRMKTNKVRLHLSLSTFVKLTTYFHRKKPLISTRPQTLKTKTETGLNLPLQLVLQIHVGRKVETVTNDQSLEVISIFALDVVSLSLILFSSVV